MKDVLVFTGEGTSPLTASHTLESLRVLLGHRYDVKRATAKMLATEPWPESTALLVIPGGRDRPYAEALAGAANERIRDYVTNGGRYLGICAGAYYACRRIEFEPRTPIEVVEDRPLGFFAGVARGCRFAGFEYDTEAGARAAALRVNKSALVDVTDENLSVYFNGGCWFEYDDDAATADVTPLLWYTEEGVSGRKDEIAMVECRVGRGSAVLSGVHFELSGRHLTSTFPETARDLLAHEPARLALAVSVLHRLGLRPLAADDVLRGDATPALTHFGMVTRTPAQDEALWQRIVAAGALDKPLTAGTANGKIELKRDRVDGQVPPRVAEGEEDSESVPQCVFRVASLRQLQGAAMDSEAYFTHLEEARSGRGMTYGDAVMFGQVVSSTQTVLEKNFAFCSALPDGFVCTATRQVAGRGRGGNAWISPSGCLQFSVVLRHSAGSTVVFLQYVMALAVVEAVRSLSGYEELPLHIKWPNDIYVKEANDAETPLRKIGGILVTSSFIKQQFLLVIGTGVNLSNSEPTDCINDVIVRYNARHGTSLRLLRKEELLARILVKFEELYERMSQADSFAPLLPLYYKRWLHSDQHVTLEQHGGLPARIAGISEYGYLRCVSLDPAAPGEYELQPDGNSFDLMKNMISMKK